MTGWRIGYLGGAASVVRNAAKIQSQVTSCTVSISQKAAVAALNGNNTEIDAMTDRFRERRDFVFSSLRDTPGLEIFRPEGAFYFLLGVGCFCNSSQGGEKMSNGTDVTRYLLEKKNVALVPGSAFGADDCIRLSYACSMSELQKGVERIKSGLLELVESRQ
jgi:aspartate aminotransferase